MFYPFLLLELFYFAYSDAMGSISSTFLPANATLVLLLLVLDES